MIIKIVLLMLLCHIIDDFVLQPVCLSKMKQKSWWEEHMVDDKDKKMYKNDYYAALTMHALSWSIMIHLPIMFMTDITSTALCISVFINCFIHRIVDDLKANKKKINLCIDQGIHLLQIAFTITILQFFI